ncbi:hypothetical protein RYX36_036858 [Vicia faba]
MSHKTQYCFFLFLFTVVFLIEFLESASYSIVKIILNMLTCMSEEVLTAFDTIVLFRFRFHLKSNLIFELFIMFFCTTTGAVLSVVDGGKWNSYIKFFKIDM